MENTNKTSEAIKNWRMTAPTNMSQAIDFKKKKEQMLS